MEKKTSLNDRSNLLDISISTVSKKLTDLESRMRDYISVLDKRISVTIISQGYSSGEDCTVVKSDRLKLIKTSTLGLSKSRNIALAS